MTSSIDAQVSPHHSGLTCGLDSDGKTIHIPKDYGTLMMPGIGEEKAIVDGQYGCPIWKIADMSVHDAGMTSIDSQDRWVLTKSIILGTRYFETNSRMIRNLHTGAPVCLIAVPGAGGFIWGSHPGDQDNLYFHEAPNEIWKLNVPTCMRKGRSADQFSRAVSRYDKLMDPQTHKPLYSNLSWCQDASDFSVDGDHLCIGENAGGFLQDPRLYTVSTKHIGPPLYGSPHQPPGCSPNPSKHNCYRGAFVAPLSNNIVLAYQPFQGRAYLDLFNGQTGEFLRTLTDYNSHGSLASYNGGDYIVDAVNGLDPKRPQSCSPGIQAIKLKDGSRTCLLDLKPVGPPGSTGDYQEAHYNGRGTDGGNSFVAADVIDYVYGVKRYTFETRPLPGSNTIMITDAVHPGDCSAGGGSNVAYCRWVATDKKYFPVSTGSYPPQENWKESWGPYTNEIYLVFLDGHPPRHMVHHRSMSVENYFAFQRHMPEAFPYWSSPRVVVSRSGKYMIWDSTWGGNDNISVYAARIK
jgi:hypothetical protein